jgi:DNA-binding transcriptional regulator LsrR (DeoR family)
MDYLRDMSVALHDSDTSNLRLITRVLTMYYMEDKNQAEIAKLLNLSTAKVNRLIKQAREQGFVEINIRTPFNHLVEIEQELQGIYSLPEAYIIPHLTDNPEAALQTLGKAAAEFLLQRLRDGDTICISGGKTVQAIVEALEPRRSYRVKVVPATGARQGKLFTDVNYLAARLAEKLGGESYQLNAPIFVDTAEECETLLSMRYISEILNMARNAQIALVGIGSIIPGVSSYFDLLANASVNVEDWQQVITETDGHGEIFAYVIDGQGQLCLPDYNQRVIGLNLDELKNIPLTIGVAATPEKARPIHGALKGNYLKTLITDEPTALGVLELQTQSVIGRK